MVEKILPGPASRASVIEFEAGHAHVAVTFALGGASCFFGLPVTALRDDLVPLEARSAEDALSVMEDARIQRLQRLVRNLDGQARVDWAAMAARHGYADQPHLADPG